MYFYLEINPEYRRMVLEYILDLNLCNSSIEFHIIGPQCLQYIRKKSMFLDLNASNPSELFHIFGPQCLQSVRTIPYFWTSMPPIHQTPSQPSNKQTSKQVSKPAIHQASNRTTQQASHPTSEAANQSACQPSKKQARQPASAS